MRLELNVTRDRQASISIILLYSHQQVIVAFFAHTYCDVLLIHTASDVQEAFSQGKKLFSIVQHR